MRIPTVHLNGTSGEELQEQIEGASRAVTIAICKIRGAWPNGRDYYIQDGDDPLREAHREWNTRVSKLEEVERELSEIAEDIGKQLERQGVDPWAPR